MELCIYSRGDTQATKHCKSCGAGLCSSCGYRNEKDEVFCNNCWAEDQEDATGKCFWCGELLEEVWENNGFTEPAGPSHWEVIGYKPCPTCPNHRGGINHG